MSECLTDLHAERRPCGMQVRLPMLSWRLSQRRIRSRRPYRASTTRTRPSGAPSHSSCRAQRRCLCSRLPASPSRTCRNRSGARVTGSPPCSRATTRTARLSTRLGCTMRPEGRVWSSRSAARPSRIGTTEIQRGGVLVDERVMTTTARRGRRRPRGRRARGARARCVRSAKGEGARRLLERPPQNAPPRDVRVQHAQKACILFGE